ncbi:hypothetical protein ACFSKW_51440 [Nonomuraea mangrovi]|uniref:Uncharacterized protein n=1 Tax=Nonomuraea mangrovi TaxID=2316207 RepID=A0ABW4TDV4_9ACTN
MWIALGVVAAVVVGVALWWRFRDPLRGESFDQFEVNRLWGWELRLSEEEEIAFMAGLRAYDNEVGSFFIHGEHGVLSLYHPPMLISMHLMADRFKAMGPAAMSDPAGAVRHLFGQAAARESVGVLHLRENWLPCEIDGMDKYGFRDAMSDALSAPGVDGVEGGYGEEDSGYGMVVVLAGDTPESVQAMYDQASDLSTSEPIRDRLDVVKAVLEEPEPEYVEALNRADGEKSRYTNTLLVDYARVLDRYAATRTQMQGAKPSDVLGAALSRMLAEQAPGTTWTRQPSQEEQEFAMQIIATRVRY